MKNINEYLIENMYKTFCLFIQHSIFHCMQDKKNQSDYLQIIVNMQTALEIILKLDIIYIRKNGWQEIFSPYDKNDSFNNKTNEEIILMFEEGKVRSKQYSNVREHLAKWYTLRDTEKEILDKFVILRNQIVHAGLNIDKLNTSLINDTTILLIKIFNELDIFKENYRPVSLNYFAEIFGEKLLSELVLSSEYAQNCKKYVEDNYDFSKYCLNCNSKCMIFEDDWHCILCGCYLSDNAVEFIDCNNCFEKGSVIFDKLNIDINIEKNGYMDGLCCKCETKIPITNCKTCGKYYNYYEHHVCYQ